MSGFDKIRIEAVASDMERHCLGHEGMEDSPVARWARELREAMGDGVTDEDREAIAWVREHGGVDELTRLFQDADSRRVELCGALGIDLDKGWSEAMAAMRLRLMPEGMEWLVEVWPMWSNGEYCRFGDWWTADRYGDYEPRQLRRLVIYTPELLDEWEQGDGESYGYEWDFMRPSELGYRPDKAVAPEPAVLAADGEPLEVGQTVWSVNDGTEYKVGGIRDTTDDDGDPCKIIECSNDELHIYYVCFPPDKLTHQRPVLDADGVPIELGDDLYSVEGSLKLHVSNIDRVNCRIATSAMFALDKWADPSMFTHTKPERDSWERIEEDARLKPLGYVDRVLGWDMSKSHSQNQARSAMTHDLVRRARALAERERGE